MAMHGFQCPDSKKQRTARAIAIAAIACVSFANAEQASAQGAQ